MREAGVVRSSWGRSIIRGPAVLTQMYVQAVSTAHDTPLAPQVVEKQCIGYKGV
jgi:hypothetical protein